MTASKFEQGLTRFLRALFIDGPRDIPPNDRSFWDTIFTWPVRLLIVVGAWAVGYVWGPTPSGIQLAWGLQYGLFIAVSIVASFWSVLLVINVGLAAWWVYLTIVRLAPKIDAKDNPEWDVLDVVTWLNRQISHVEVLGTYIAIALVLTPRLVYQLPFLAVVLALGAPLIDGITQLKMFGGTETRVSRSRLLTQRRLLIYILSFLGLLVLAFRAPDQLWDFAPLLATAIPGLVVRFVRFKTRRAQERDPRKAPLLRTALASDSAAPVSSATVKNHSNARATLQRNATPWFAPALTLAVIAVVVGVLEWQAGRVARAASDERDGPPAPEGTCARESGGPSAPAAITMFVVADSQLHELGGKRFPGQMEVANTLVSVARRPVELDVLSTAAVIRFGKVFDQLAPFKKDVALPLWAHLGDLSDLSCTREIERMIGLLDGYGGKGSHRMAGVAPGNHDSAFTGNFEWSPFWAHACEDDHPAKAPEGASLPATYGRLDKAASDARLEVLFQNNLKTDAVKDVVKGRFLDGLWRASPKVWGNASARFTVTPLGVLPADANGKQRGVVAIFIDTADRLSRNFGIAGTYGTFSSKQADAIQEKVAKFKRESGGAFADPWYVIFGHSPYNELTGSSRKALDGLFSWLDIRHDTCQPGDDLCNGPRIVAFIAAHTHHAEAHRHCVNGRLLREIVVGSVIDPPQQAAKLEIGPDARGRASVRLTTLPAVGREGLTCEANFSLPAGRCHQVVAELNNAKECIDLVDGPDSGDDRAKSCEELERPLSLDDQLAGLVRHGGPRDPDLVKEADTKRARALLRCLCRSDQIRGITPPAACDGREPPLEGERYTRVVEALATNPDRADEVTCLAWAASSVQEHKANGMTLADALRCAFDDPTLPSARAVVATSEDVACP